MAYRLSSMSYITLGYDDEDPDNFHETGSLTSFGNEVYRRTKILNSPVLRFIDGVIASF